MSVVVLWSEISITIGGVGADTMNLSPTGLILEADPTRSDITSQLILLVPYVYMSVCLYSR